ncbi:MAG: MarR family transcriptional regulator [Dehalococcoidia bacterium]
MYNATSDPLATVGVSRGALIPTVRPLVGTGPAASVQCSLMRAPQPGRWGQMNNRGLPSQQGRFRGRTGLDAWTTVHRIFNLWSQAVDAILQPLKLSNAELVVLISLAHAGDALPVSQIARATLFETDRLRRAVDKLEARGLVTRSHQQKDRRKVFVRMEEGGQRLLNSIAPALFEFMRQMIDARGPQDAEFMRAKVRKVVAYAGTHHRGTSRDPRYGTRKGARTVQTLTGTLVSESHGRPRTMGLAGWLRAAEWSNHTDRIWRRESQGLGLTVPQLHVLAILAEAGASVAEDAVARITGLHQDRVRSVLCALERAGFVRKWREKRRSRDELVKLTTEGEHKVLDSLPMASSHADELWQELTDDEVERVLSLLPKFCAAAERAVDGRARDTAPEAPRPSLGEVA